MQQLTSSAEEEVSSPFRIYLFDAMAAVLAVVVVVQGGSAVYTAGGDACIG